MLFFPSVSILYNMQKTVFAVEPPSTDVVRQWYEQHEPAITECLGSSFPGPHDTFKAVDHHIMPKLKAHFSAERLRSLKICDLGSGGGGVTCYLAKQLVAAASVGSEGSTMSSIGVTLTQAAVDESQALAISEGVSEFTSFKVGDYHDVSELFPDPSCFDVVCLINSLCHARSVPEVLREAFRILKPDGIVIIKDFYALPLNSLFERGLQEDAVREFMVSAVGSTVSGSVSTPDALYEAFISKYATNFCMGIFDRTLLESLISEVALSAKNTAAVQFLELDENTFEGRAFACNCFADKNPKTGQFSSFGKVVLEGFPPNVVALQLAPFDEGIWIVMSK